MDHTSDTVHNFLYLRRLGIDTHQEPVVYMRQDCDVCKSEGFNAHSRVRVSSGGRSIIATVNVVTQDFLSHQEAGLSEAAWRLLGASDGDKAHFAHTRPVDSMSYVRGKLYGNTLDAVAADAIIQDVTHGYYSDIQLTAFVTACAGSRLSPPEVTALTQAMVRVGERIDWGHLPVMDKHCVGGLPGNRTTPLAVAIVSSCGLIMPKTSSRAITSPAGTADTMEVMAPVELSLSQMRRVVEQEGGCIAWGGSVSLSPADDVLIRIERALDLDSEGQMVASVLSKKIAAGSSHVLLDIPVGPTAKVRNRTFGERLAAQLTSTGETLGLTIRTHLSDGSQPIGRGIGPALEARDILQVLRGDPQAPQDLRQRALQLAGMILEMGGVMAAGEGLGKATEVLDSGLALRKFLAICEAQGGFREPTLAPHRFEVSASRRGIVSQINNRFVAKLAKLAGAPADPRAGLDFQVQLGQKVDLGEPLFVIHAESPGELAYTLEFLREHPDEISIVDESL